MGLELALVFVTAAVPIEPPASLLHRAAFLGETEVVARALDTGADVNAAVEHGWTALHWAAIGGQAEIAQLLLEHGANPDVRAQFDMTPLHWAALRDHPRVLAVLAARGASLDARNLYGMTALHLAGTQAAVLTLAEAGATINARDDQGLTPMFTVRTKEAGQAVLASGADIHTRANDGRMLFDMLLVNTMQRDGLILFGRRSSGRLRGDDARISIQLMNVSPMPLDQISLHVETRAASTVDPPPIARLRPGEFVSVPIELTRRAELAEATYPMAAQVSSKGKALGIFDMEIDTNRQETPSDRGMARLGRAQVRTTPWPHYQLFLLAVPILVLAGWWIAQHRRRR